MSNREKLLRFLSLLGSAVVILAAVVTVIVNSSIIVNWFGRSEIAQDEEVPLPDGGNDIVVSEVISLPKEGSERSVSDAETRHAEPPRDRYTALPDDVVDSATDVWPSDSSIGMWPVNILISVDKDTDGAVAWDPSTTLTDKTFRPEIVLVAIYSDGQEELLLGPGYDWLFTDLGVNRDFSAHPCNETFECVITNEIMKENSFRVKVYEYDSALNPMSAGIEEFGEMFCTVDVPCGGVGVNVLFKSL